MSGSISGSDRGGHGTSLRQLELERIKARAEAKAAQYRAMAVQLEAKLQQEKRGAAQSAAPKPKAKTPPLPPAPKKAAAVVPVRSAILEEEEDRERLSVFWDDVSSWLTSAVVHLVIILILGIFTLNMADESPTIELTATIDADDAAELEELQAFDVKLEDPGLAKLGETTSVLEHVTDAGQVDLAAMQGEIGTLFGKDGKGWASTGTGGATFFGVKSAGNRFVFVVDASTSMNRNGWEACQRELIAAVSRLKSYQSFYVILFNREPHRMFSEDDPEPKMVNATPENIERLRKWLYSVPLASGTYPKSSMRLALSLDPDGIYFLSDGRLHDDTEEFLKKHNQRKDRYEKDVPKVPVQTIGFYTNEGREVLKRIARANRGTFRYVARPPNDPPKNRRRLARPRG